VRLAGPQWPAVGQRGPVGHPHHVRVQHRDDRLQVAGPGGGQERFDHPAVPGQLGRGHGGRAADPEPGPAGQSSTTSSALVPAITHVAMRDVPAGASGAASGLLNSSRQAGTSVGLAVLGSIGTGAATAAWAAQAARFPRAARAAARGQAQNVADGRIAAVTRTLGGDREPAVAAFVHGYHLAVGTGALCLLLAALATLLLPARPRQHQPPAGGVSPRQPAQRAR
jgi:hypothetical protein